MATYYVRPINGNDANDGLSFGAAFATTQKALDTAVAGDTVYLCAEATETTAAQIDADTHAGTSTSFIRFIGANSAGVVDGTRYTLRASGSITALIGFAPTSDYSRWENVIFDGNSLAGVCLNNTADGSDSHQFLNCRIHGATGHGVIFRGFASQYFTECEIDSNGGAGLASGTGNRGSFLLESCSIHDNGSHGVFINSALSTMNRLIRCRIYDNGGNGINSSTSATHVTVDSCTIFGNTGDGVNVSASISVWRILNSAFVSNGGYGVNFNSTINTCIYLDYNHTQDNTRGGTDINGGVLPGDNNVTGDPLFTSVADGSEDFTPLPGSPLIGAGLNGTTIGALAGEGRFPFSGRGIQHGVGR